MRIVVVGAGLGGLSAAAHLSNRGHQVTVLERDSVPGGRAGVLAEAGFQLDTGPTALTMPEVLSATFAAAGSDLADFVRLHPVDPMYRAVFDDGSTLYIRRGREAMTEEIRAFSGPRDAEAFGRFSRLAGDASTGSRCRTSSTSTSIRRSISLRSWRAVASLVGRGGFGRMGKRIGSYFDDERLQQVFGSQSLYAGLAPHQALAIQTVVTHTDTNGVFVPEGGMHTIAKSLAGAVEKAGVKIRYRSPVTRLLRGAAGSINGVEVGGSDPTRRPTRSCATPISRSRTGRCSAASMRHVSPGAAATRRRACSGSPACAASDQRARPTTTCTSAAEWDESVKAVITTGTSDAGSVDPASRSRRAESTVAPDGCSSLYVLEPMPNLDGRIDWSKERDRIAGDLRRRVAAFGYPNDVVVERVVRPPRLGGDGSRTRHAVRARPHHAPERPVPPEQRRPAGARAGVRRLVDTSRVWGCRWCSSPAGSPPTGSISTPRADVRRDGGDVRLT